MFPFVFQSFASKQRSSQSISRQDRSIQTLSIQATNNGLLHWSSFNWVVLGSPIIITFFKNNILYRGAGRTHPPTDHLLLARFRTIITVLFILLLAPDGKPPKEFTNAYQRTIKSHLVCGHRSATFVIFSIFGWWLPAVCLWTAGISPRSHSNTWIALGFIPPHLPQLTPTYTPHFCFPGTQSPAGC